MNPDFGQVEADPSVINLTAYETFFEEKRPVLPRGEEHLPVRPGEGLSDGGNMLYYSRRIGAAPSLLPSLGEGEFTGSPPAATTILTALKVTGKTRNGLSVGLVQSLGSKETVDVSVDGRERSQVVEPATHYLAGRVQKDWAKGNTILGGMVTSTHRWIERSGARLPARPMRSPRVSTSPSTSAIARGPAGEGDLQPRDRRPRGDPRTADRAQSTTSSARTPPIWRWTRPRLRCPATVDSSGSDDRATASGGSRIRCGGSRPVSS